MEPRSVLSRAGFFAPPRFAFYKGETYLWHQVESHLGTFHNGRALLDRAAPQSKFGVATCLGFFVVVTRLKVGFAAEAALFRFGSDFGRSHLVSRRSSGNPIKDSLSGIVWFLHGLILQPREARGLQVRRSPAAPAQGCWKTGSVARRPLLAQPGSLSTLGLDAGRYDPSHWISCDTPRVSRCHASQRRSEAWGAPLPSSESTSHLSVGNNLNAWLPITFM
jgi:hypothetical protein